jgi:hypothetical protein
MIPTELGQLRALEGLWLYMNKLVGSIPAEFGNLTGLKWLSLESNQLSFQIPPALGQLSGLLELELGSNQFTGEVPTALDLLPGLQLLQLENNNLVGTVSATVCTSVTSGRLEVSVDCGEVACSCGCTCGTTPPPAFPSASYTASNKVATYQTGSPIPVQTDSPIAVTSLQRSGFQYTRPVSLASGGYYSGNRASRTGGRRK